MRPQHLTHEIRELPLPHPLCDSLARVLRLSKHKRSNSLIARNPCRQAGTSHPLPPACLMGTHCPAPRGTPTWDIKVSHAEDKPTPMEIPQTLTNWSHTQEKTQGLSGPREGTPGGDPPSGRGGCPTAALMWSPPPLPGRTHSVPQGEAPRSQL